MFYERLDIQSVDAGAGFVMRVLPGSEDGSAGRRTLGERCSQTTGKGTAASRCDPPRVSTGWSTQAITANAVGRQLGCALLRRSSSRLIVVLSDFNHERWLRLSE